MDQYLLDMVSSESQLLSANGNTTTSSATSSNSTSSSSTFMGMKMRTRQKSISNGLGLFSSSTASSGASTLAPDDSTMNSMSSGHQSVSSGVGLPVQIKSAVSSAPVSLFASCMSLIEKLYSFPLFEFYLFPDGIDAYLPSTSSNDSTPPPLIDPVNILWTAFKLGAPLCMIYNHLLPRNLLNVSDVSSVRPPDYKKVCKDNVYHFILACKNDLGLKEASEFSISELYKDDTHGFVKVLKMVQFIVDRIESNNLLPPPKPLPFSIPNSSSSSSSVPQDNRSRVIKELIDTERAYIASLELLESYQDEGISSGILGKDMAHGLFANLKELLDFQRKFLIVMESMLVLPPNEQRIGQLFLIHEEGFEVYNEFCGNYNFATSLVVEEIENLKKLSHIIEPHMLQSYLIKPVQRICKFPLLLNELVKLSENTDYPHLEELKAGLDSIKRVTERINEQTRRAENETLKNNLADRMEDWKGLNIYEFGDLILNDKFTMMANDQEREYQLFLFERILLCCKDLQKPKKTKKKSGLSGKETGGNMYSLKGNIYIVSIAGVEDTSDNETGMFALKVYWKDGNDMVCFTLRCRNGEQSKLWKERLESLVILSKTGRQRRPSIVPTPQPRQGSIGSSSSETNYAAAITSSLASIGLFTPPPAMSAPPNMGRSKSMHSQSSSVSSSTAHSNHHTSWNSSARKSIDHTNAHPDPRRESNSSRTMSGRPPSGSSIGSDSYQRVISPAPPIPTGGSSGYGHQDHSRNRAVSGPADVGYGYNGSGSNGSNSRNSDGDGVRHMSNHPNRPPPSFHGQGSRSYSTDPHQQMYQQRGAPGAGGYSDDDDASDDEYFDPRMRPPPPSGVQSLRSNQQSQSQQQQQHHTQSAQFKTRSQPPPPRAPMQRTLSAKAPSSSGSQNHSYTPYNPPPMPSMPSQIKPQFALHSSQEGLKSAMASPSTRYAPPAPWNSNGQYESSQSSSFSAPPNVPPPPPPSSASSSTHSHSHSQQTPIFSKRSTSIPSDIANGNGPTSARPLSTRPGPSPHPSQSPHPMQSPQSSTSSPQPNNNYTPYMNTVAPPRTVPPSIPLPPPPVQAAGPPLNSQLSPPPPNNPPPKLNPPPPMKRAPTAPLPPPPTLSSVHTTSQISPPVPVPAPSSTPIPAPAPTPTPSSVSTSTTTTFIKVRTHFENEVFVIAFPSRGATYSELESRIERKIRLIGAQAPSDVGRRMRITWKQDDYDGAHGGSEFVSISGDEDVNRAFEVAKEGLKGERGVVNLFVQ